MGKKVMAAWIFWGLIFVGLPVFAGPVPDTGQTTCYDNNGNMITCPSPGQRFYGQDANYIINSPSYSKLDGNGNALPVSASSWVMVRDNVTGLIWEVKQHNDWAYNYDDPHDANNVYTWYDPDPATNGGDPGTPGAWWDTDDFINALNDVHFGGYSDWRMPDRKELRSIVNYDLGYPAINTVYFPNTLAGYYWSSTTYAGSSGGAWGMHFSNGGAGWTYKAGGYSVRAVRGGQCLASFHDNGNGTVSDTSTGLMWQQDTARDEWGDYDYMTWEEALDYCEVLSLGGHTDWRLPNIKELDSLVDLSRYNPAINTFYFPNTLASTYWSSTTYPYHAWYMHFDYGYDNWFNKSSTSYVRAVRGGQGGSLSNLISFPNGGESLLKGQSYTIIWDSANVSGNIQIDLYKGGTEPGNMIMQLAASTENDGEYLFNPPDCIADGDDYLIRISSENGTIWDFSNSFFTINKAQAKAMPWIPLLLLDD